MTRSRRATALLTIALTLASPPAVAQRAAEPIDAARVLASIDRAVSYLKRAQTARGGWDDPAQFPGGVTALCTLALLNAGLDASDPGVAEALDYLRKIQPKKTYVVAVQTMVFCAAEPQRDRVAIQRNVDWLERAQRKNGDLSGSWGYSDEPGGTDPSNSQFAVLGLYEAQRVGARVNPETWRLAAAYWRKQQNADGSWNYPSRSPSGSMTCAGIGALTITNLAGADTDARVEGGKVLCCQPQSDDEAIERGLAWLGRNFSVRTNPGDANWHDFYYLYGLERVGRLTARRFIGDHDWYRAGTTRLVRTQNPLRHSWQGSGTERNLPEVATSFALLFLAKGRRPILMAKAKFGADDTSAWNAHRHDAAHLTESAERAWRLPMTWQVIDAERASVDDLNQTPVLYVSGSDVDPLAAQAAKLRDYLDRGGFLLMESSCAKGAASRASAERLVAAMFPEPEYRLRQLRPTHPLWRMERLVRPDSPYVGSLWAVEYGCRTCVVLCDRDLSCYWELNRPIRVREYPDSVRRQIDDADAIGLNVLAYATGREPRGKEQQFVERVEAIEVDGPGARGVIQIAKLRHGGGCDDAPGALANLLRAAAEGETRLRVAPQAIDVGPADPALRRSHFGFMHGRRQFKFSPAERRALRGYLENGGTLLIDAICASREFAKSARGEIATALGGRALQRVPADDPLFTDAYGGFDVRRVAVRRPQPAADDQPLAARVRQQPPELEGVRIGGRWAVLFSPLDLSCALENHEAIECRGYRREDAARIALNVLLYSINQ